MFVLRQLFPEFLKNLWCISGRANRAEGSLVIATEDRSTLATTSDMLCNLDLYMLRYHVAEENLCKVYVIGQSAELVTFTARDAMRFVLSFIV